MAAGTYNLTGSYAIERGACYSYSMDLSTSTGEYTLSGYSVSGFLRRKWDGAVGPYWDATITSTGSGIVNMALTATQTSSLTLDDYQHEVYIYPPSSGCPVRVLVGDVTVEGGG